MSKKNSPRETLLGQLTVYVRGIRDDFIARTQNSYSGGKDGSGPPRGRNMPEIVNNIVWVRQLDAKVRLNFIMIKEIWCKVYNPFKMIFIHEVLFHSSSPGLQHLIFCEFINTSIKITAPKTKSHAPHVNHA